MYSYLESKSPYHEEHRIYDKNWEYIWWFVEWVDFLDVTVATCMWLPFVDGNILIWKFEWFMKDEEIYEKLYNSIVKNLDMFNYNHDYNFYLGEKDKWKKKTKL